jgi:site-specific recombinase XerD
LQTHRIHQNATRQLAGQWQEHNLVVASVADTELGSHNIQRAFRKVVETAGLGSAPEWTLREMRHSIVSLLSASGVALEDIAWRVGHSGTAVTEAVHCKQIGPVMDRALRQ